MYSVKRLFAVCLALLMLLMASASAEIPFLVHSQGWQMENTPVEVVLKAAVEAHQPFDKDRVAMLIPVTDLLSLRLVAGENEGSVAISVADEEALALQYRGNEVQLSSMPGVTYAAQSDPIAALLGGEAASIGGYEALKLSPDGESLLQDGKVLLAQIPAAFEANGKKSKVETNISGYGKSTYRIDYTIAAGKVVAMKETLLSICPDGWLKDIISSLTFKDKQTLRVYYTAQDEIVRIEYNGSCGPEGSLRTVKLVGRFRSDDAVGKDYLELTSPAKKGKDKNNLTFERTVEINKKGARVVSGSYKYNVTKDGVNSAWSGSFSLMNTFTDDKDVITGEATFETKLNGESRADAITFTPVLNISGTQEDPLVEGEINIVQKAGTKVAEQAKITLMLKHAEPIMWAENDYVIDLSTMDEESVTVIRQEVARSLATSIVRPLINRMGKDADWFFRDIPAEAVQSIIDAAAYAEN